MFTYRLVFIVFSPIILIHLCWKSLQLKSLRYFKQRLGFSYKTTFQNPVWFHCASVGEVNTVLPLIHNLQQCNKQLQFIISSNTATSAGIIQKQNKSYIQHYYLPIDWASATRRFIAVIKPSILFIIETELWPNLIDVCRHKSIDTYIINARLTPKTTETNRWMAAVYQRALKKITHIYARSESDESRFIALGANADKITRVGNLKYALNKKPISKQEITKREYVILASSHDDEEFQLAQCWQQLQRHELLVIAPRHPHRKKQIINQLQALSQNIISRTDNSEITDDVEIFILDTVGELASWFVNAKVVILGGSFVNHGGHNVIEPAQQAKAIIFGPHMENFEFESRLLLENKAAIQVSTTDELASTLNIVLDNEATRAQLESAAAATVKPFEAILSQYTDIVLKHVSGL